VVLVVVHAPASEAVLDASLVSLGVLNARDSGGGDHSTVVVVGQGVGGNVQEAGLAGHLAFSFSEASLPVPIDIATSAAKGNPYLADFWRKVPRRRVAPGQ
jgi:hypothetical protein